MSVLPPMQVNKPHPAPHNFFIFGAPMSGKSYFASFFPNPLVLNTDGNSAQGTAPSIQIRNVRNEDGSLKQSAIKQLDDIVLALQTENLKRPPEKQFKTVVVDVIDDICVMIEQAICYENHVKALSDIPYGKGYSMFYSALQEFVMDLKALPINVIYISREISITDDQTGRTEYIQSLKPKYFNIVNGNCDLVIRCQKLGNDSYWKSVIEYRTEYKKENIKDKRVLALLERVHGMFNKESK